MTKTKQNCTCISQTVQRALKSVCWSVEGASFPSAFTPRARDSFPSPPKPPLRSLLLTSPGRCWAGSPLGSTYIHLTLASSWDNPTPWRANTSMSVTSPCLRSLKRCKELQSWPELHWLGRNHPLQKNPTLYFLTVSWKGELVWQLHFCFIIKLNAVLKKCLIWDDF